jgi:formylglycine-generating enzyme required for sulfatase activity
MADDWFDTHEGADCTDAKRTTQRSERLRVVRGASWYVNPWVVRSASRGRIIGRGTFTGFRLARTL